MQLATILLSIMVNFNQIAAMKKFMKSLVLFAAAAMALTSCENEMMNEGIESNETYTMNFVAGEPESRTSVKVDGENVTFAWANEGETFAFAQNTTEGLELGTSVSFNNNGGLAEITATFTEATSPIVAVYPEAAWVDNNENYNKVKLIVLKDQDILDGTFDPKADLMVSEQITPENATDTHLLKFGRVVAVGKMTVSNLPVVGTETIEKVNFSISSENALTGRLYIDLATGVVSEWGYYDNAYNEVNLINGNVVATASNDFYFTCMPATVAAGETFTVEVTTDAATYTRTVTIPEGKSIEFACGKVSTFSVNMASAERALNEGIALPWSEGFDSEDLSKYDVVNGSSDTEVYADDNLAKGVAKGEILIGKGTGSLTATLASDGTAKTLNLWFKSNYGERVSVSSATEGVTITKITNTGYTVALAEGVKVFKLTLYNNNATENVRVDDIMLTEDAPYIEKLTITGATVLFTEGETFDRGESFTVTANYINGVNEDVTADVTVNSDAVNMATAGTYDVTVSYEGVEATYTVTVQSAAIKTATATLTFDDTSKRTVGTTTQQVWVENGITVTNNKGSGSNVNTSYFKPVRFYQNSEVIVAAPGNITKIVFNANTTGHASSLSTSIDKEAATVNVNSTDVTVVPTNSAATFTIAKLSAQVRLDSVTVTYVLSGEQSKPVDQTVTWTSNVNTVEVGKTITVAATAETAIKYTSSNEAIATVDAETGVVTGIAEGNVTITATAAATADYNEATATLDITVTPASTGGGDVPVSTSTVLFDTSASGTNPFILNGSGTAATLDASKDGISIKITKESSSSNCALYSPLRFYKGHKMTFSSSKKITKIVFSYNTTDKEAAKLTIDTGSGSFSNLVNNVGTYTCAGETTIAFIAPSQVRFNSIEVTYEN